MQACLVWDRGDCTVEMGANSRRHCLPARPAALHGQCGTTGQAPSANPASAELPRFLLLD